jgi:hypothetical protein
LSPSRTWPIAVAPIEDEVSTTTPKVPPQRDLAWPNSGDAVNVSFAITIRFSKLPAV